MKMKFSPIKSAFIAMTAVAVTGCIEVEDDSNAELTAAVQQQNQILSEQLQQQEVVYTVTMTGVVVDAFDSQPLSNATVTVRTPTEVVAENQSIESGQFTIEGLPANSSVEVIISSPDDSFLTRVFYLSTGDVTSGNAIKDFGIFRVSEGETYTIEVLESETNMPIEGLEFNASSAVNTGANASAFDHVGTFDEVNGVYTIELPKFINTVVYASIDADRDGERDYVPENFSYVSGTRIRINSFDLDDLEPIRLGQEGASVLNEVQVRLSVVNGGGESLTSANVILEDSNNDIQATFDEIAEQYIVDAIFDRTFRIEIPAFEEGELRFQSSQVTVTLLSSSNQLEISGTGVSFTTVPYNEVVNLVVRPSEIASPATDLRTLFINNPKDAENNALTVFYSVPVDVSAESVTLTNRSAYTVVKGNDDSDDTVLPGNTVINGGVEVPVAVSMGLNGTKLTVTPTVELESQQSHSYSVGAITVVGEDASVNLSNEDSVSFTSALLVSEEEFDIADVVADNNNYATNGVPIQTTNTAGDPTNSTNFNRTVYLVFPDTLNQLQQFNMRLVSRVNDGTVIAEGNNYEIICNGSLRTNTVNFLSLAQNESVSRNGTLNEFYHGTAQPDQSVVYVEGIFGSMSDDLTGQENSLTFDYAYETKAGEVFTGTVTLPVQ
jgi:hypothetical protein